MARDLLRSGGMSHDHWNARPLAEVIDHVISEFHAPLAGELEDLRACVRSAREGCDGGPRRLNLLAREVRALEEELNSHTLKEEAVLFPWIRGGRGALAGAPIRAMMLEHSDVTARLERIRKLLPCKGAGCDEGCGALRDCVQRFEARLLRHMALENEVLFPRALRSDN